MVPIASTFTSMHTKDEKLSLYYKNFKIQDEHLCTYTVDYILCAHTLVS